MASDFCPALQARAISIQGQKETVKLALLKAQESGLFYSRVKNELVRNGIREELEQAGYSVAPDGHPDFTRISW